MAIDFPPTPALGEIYTYNGRSWQWNGTAWDVYSPAGGLTQYVSKLNGLSGSINIAAGTSISVTPTGNTLTIAYTGTGGGGNTGATGATGATGPQGNTGATGATGSTPTNYVASFNGLTGAVTGVNSIRGLTGTIGITNGSGITLSVSGQTLTISHLVTNEDTNATRYIGFYGSTSGTDTPRTDIGLIYNPFTQTISGVGGLVLSGITSGAFSENSIRLYDSGSILITSNDGNVNFTTPGAVGGDVASLSLLSQDGLENGFTAKIVPQAYYSGARTFTLPDDSGTVALTKNVVSSFNGLTGAVTGVTTGTANTFGPLQSFTNGISASGATFSGLIRANAGISAAGITVGGSVVLQNAEYIKNTTNGRIDLMPAPSGSTHYGLYVDTTSWGFGPRLGTIRSSDGVLNNASILWDAGLYLANNVTFSFGSNGQNGLVLSDTGNDTVQLYTNVTTGTNSGAFAIVDNAGVNTANRAPGTTHTNPNLYIYRAGSARATDFIRFEHNGTNGRIVSGGTSGISIEPGSGVLGISGGISASGATFSGTINLNGQTFTNIVSSINGLTGTIGLSAGSNITITSSGNTLTISSSGGGGAVSSVSGTGSGILVSPTTGAVVVENTGVQNINGLTGAVTAVTSIEGLTGDVVIPAIDLYYFNIGII